MHLAIDDPPPAAPLPRGPWADLLARIADEVVLDGSVRIAGELVSARIGCRLLTAALSDALHERYFRSSPSLRGPRATTGRGGGGTVTRIALALRQQFLGRDGWTFRYGSAAGVPVFVVAAGGGPGNVATSVFLDLTPAIAPEVFARMVTTLEGYGLGFRAELRGESAYPERLGAAVVTVARPHAAAVARIALRMRERSPLTFGTSVAPFTRPLAPGIGLADEPGNGMDFGRHRCRLIASALVAAGPGAGPAQRRAAVVQGLIDAGLDPAALHLNPGHREVPTGR
ncbi:MAG: hypothetical protein JWQ45_1891 [Blastococcus sp.]|jgi:hypothetical protein|nr:hypothetical protein [Blastococcus sp.]